MKYTITEALVKLKVTTKKIEDATRETLVGCAVTSGNKALPPGFKNEEEYKQEVSRRLEKVTGLVKFRDKLKKAVVESNAVTRVKVGSQEMTVAEAVEKKASIAHKKTLFNHLNLGLANLELAVQRGNAVLDSKADEYVQKCFAGLQAQEDQKNAARKTFIESNTARVITSDKMKATLDSLKDEIEEFETNVDVALSVSNAKTEVEVSD